MFVYQLMHMFVSLGEHSNTFKIYIKMLPRVSVCDHHQGSRTWA